jgi:glutamate-1-semialdehyde aminotransferase
MKAKPAFDSQFLGRAEKAIAHGALTNSKRPSSFVKGVYPTHLTKGKGCYVWDRAGNRYTDFICGLGSNLLGYANDEINDAMAAQARLGATLSLGTEIEVELAERVRELFPFVERLRFLKTGSDACTAALRIARASTGLSGALSDGYHGWHDEFVSLTPPASGVGDYSQCISRLSSFMAHDWRSVAAVIVEPIITDASAERIAWLRELRESCTKAGAVLIFDEVITGLRFPALSVAKQYGIEPDLICLGKAFGGGMPLSIVGGRRDSMESDYFVSSTFAGETLSLAAAKKTLELLTSGRYNVQHLWDAGEKFMGRFNETTAGVVGLEGYATRSKLTGTPEMRALFMQEACRAGLLFGPSFFFNFPHMEIVDEVLSTVSDIVSRIKTGSVSLEGEMPQAPYAEKVRS